MNDIRWGFVLLFLLATLIGSLSQILLKKAAQRQYPNRLREYLNPLVISAYFLFFTGSTMVVFAYRGVALSLGPVLEATGYIHVALLSALFLREKLTAKKILGNALIVLGIVIYALF